VGCHRPRAQRGTSCCAVTGASSAALRGGEMFRLLAFFPRTLRQVRHIVVIIVNRVRRLLPDRPRELTENSRGLFNANRVSRGHNTQFADYQAAGRLSAPRGETLLLSLLDIQKHSWRVSGQEGPRGISCGCEVHSARTRHNTTCFKQG
jgi:hypothetical protein